MAATIFHVLKSCMGAGTPLIPSPYFMKTYPRVSYPVNRFTAGSSRSLLKTQNKPVVVNCCVGPADDVSNKGWSYWKFKGDIRRWCDKQSLPVGAAVYILVEAIQSAVFGFVWKMLGDHLIFEILSGLEQRRHYFGMYYPLVLCFFGRPLLVGRSYAVIKACTFGTAYVMKRLRPNDQEGSDLLTYMIAGFLTPVVFSLVAGLRNLVIIPIGVICALVSGFMFILMDN